MFSIVPNTTETLSESGITIVTTEKEQRELFENLGVGTKGTQMGDLRLEMTTQQLRAREFIEVCKVTMVSTTRVGEIQNTDEVNMAKHLVVAKMPIHFFTKHYAPDGYQGRIQAIEPKEFNMLPAMIIFTHAMIPVEKFEADYEGFPPLWLPILNTDTQMPLNWYLGAQQYKSEGHPLPELAAQIDIAGEWFPHMVEALNLAAANIRQLSDIRQLLDMEL